MAKVLILYAASSLHAALAESVIKPARENGQAIRLIGTEFFREGQAETGAAQVVFVRRDAKKHVAKDTPKEEFGALVEKIEGVDQAVFEQIVATYPTLEVVEVSESKIELPTLVVAAEEAVAAADDEVKALREKLIKLGGSVPAGADKAKLEELIAEAEAAAKKDTK